MLFHLFFCLTFGSHSFILLFFWHFINKKKNQFRLLTLKCYFSSYFVLISDLLIFLLILSFCFEFFCECFFLISPLNQWILFIFFLAFIPLSFISLCFFFRGAFIKLIFFYSLTLKYYFSSYFVSLSDLIFFFYFRFLT
jgi:hypothetical protein